MRGWRVNPFWSRDGDRASQGGAFDNLAPNIVLAHLTALRAVSGRHAREFSLFRLAGLWDQ